MGRPRKFSDADIIAAHADDPYPPAIAAALGCTVVCVYKHLHRLKLKGPDLRRGDRPPDDQLFSEYTGLTRIKTIARRHKTSTWAVRDALQRVVESWPPSGMPAGELLLPRPHRIVEVKIVNALRKNPRLFNNVPQLAYVAATQLPVTDHYVNRVFGFMAKQVAIHQYNEHKQQQQHKGRRAKGGVAA